MAKRGFKRFLKIMKLEDRHLTTFTGKKFHPFSPSVDEICIEDIAHSLSRVCRYSGQCPRFYSVAEHSVKVASLLPPHLKLEGLLHDASEAYISDLPKPVKIHLPEYVVIEKGIEEAVSCKFNLEYPLDKAVKWADGVLLRHEIMEFFGAEVYEDYFGPWKYSQFMFDDFGNDPKFAKSDFIDLYKELTE
jgi:hypothetical protein